MSQNPLFIDQQVTQMRTQIKIPMLDLNLDEENWDEDHSDRGHTAPTQPEEDINLEGPSTEEQTRHSPSPQPETYQPG